jgi:hypothetical protein
LLRTPRERGHIRLAQFEFTTELRGQALDESRVGAARSSAQLMIEMADDEPPVSEFDQPMQQRDRVTSAGHADEVRFPERKLLKKLQLEARLIYSALPHSFGM